MSPRPYPDEHCSPFARRFYEGIDDLNYLGERYFPITFRGRMAGSDTFSYNYNIGKRLLGPDYFEQCKRNRIRRAGLKPLFRADFWGKYAWWYSPYESSAQLLADTLNPTFLDDTQIEPIYFKGKWMLTTTDGL